MSEAFKTSAPGFMGSLLPIVLCAVALGALQQCGGRNEGTSAADLSRLKRKYSAEAVNYFYETAYSRDYAGPSGFLPKWGNDIWLRTEGELWPNDSLYVVRAVAQLNALSLPVKLHLTEDASLANATVYFGDYEYLEHRLGLTDYELFLGIGNIHAGPSSAVERAEVGIANNARSYAGLGARDSAMLRQHIILEEITQTLGVTGDSWEHHSSVFFEGKSKTTALYELDKEVIGLLYEPCIPAGYPRERFEQDFRDVLYHTDSKEKLLRHVREHGVPLRHLERIRDNAFLDGSLLKFPRRVFVKVEGDFRQQDLEFCRKAVEKLNAAGNRLELEIAPNDMWHQAPGITVRYNDSARLASPIAERLLETDGFMFTRRVRGTIKLSYGGSGRPGEQEERNRLLFGAMYRMLGLDHHRGAVMGTDSAGNILFKPDCGEVLSLIYSPVLPNGFSQKEMEEVIGALREEHSLQAGPARNSP